MQPTVWSQERFDHHLAGPGTDTTRVELWSLGERLTDNAPFQTCTVKEQRVTGLRMKLDLTVEPSRQWERWLQRPRLEAQVYKGIRAGGHSEEFAWGLFLLDPPKRSLPVASYQFSADDRWSWVINDDFPTDKGAYSWEMREAAAWLIWEVGPGYPNHYLFFPSVTATSTVHQPDGLWTKSRSETIAEMMAAIGADAYYDRIGNALIEDHVPEPTGSILRDGEGGTVVTAVDEPDFASLGNVYFVTSSAQDIWFEPVQVQVTNPVHPAHPNLIGRRVKKFASPLLFTPDQARLAGETLLAKSSQLARRYTVTCVPDPRREVGDAITVQTDLGTDICVVEEISFPSEGPMTIVAAVDVMGPQSFPLVGGFGGSGFGTGPLGE